MRSAGEVQRLHLDRRSPEQREEARGQVLVQLYFTMLHESFHIIFRHSPESAKMAAETTRELLRDMKDELADQLSLITNDETALGLQDPRASCRTYSACVATGRAGSDDGTDVRGNEIQSLFHGLYRPIGQWE